MLMTFRQNTGLYTGPYTGLYTGQYTGQYTGLYTGLYHIYTGRYFLTIP